MNFSHKEEGRRKKEEGRRKKEEGRRKKEEGRRKKEEGRRKKEEGRRKKEEGRRKKEEGRRKRKEGRGKGCISVWRLANMCVGAKHDRNQYEMIANNLYAVMLRPLLFKSEMHREGRRKKEEGRILTRDGFTQICNKNEQAHKQAQSKLCFTQSVI
ncbi:MAG: hypothetical protein JGK10_06750 [Microcoleus sp. PH2017_13_LAR_U_A]|uniref:hypothetical protein n=2 Tax=Microcoleus TaxID=44471 RepID=UPI001D9AE57F|nr:hypothetical protein [Microcoleus sp. PH2017_13_LAR_U_A]MCC3471518.1 hypothetical protein [Microcoleus sp. PH2017_13_LAR_U_A]